MLRVGALVAAAGVALVIFSPVVPVALAGALLWGAGAALGFPVGMSAGADEPARAAARVGVVSSIGYTAFLAGPPLIGFLAEVSSLRQALGVVLVAALVGLLAAGSARPLATHSDHDEDRCLRARQEGRDTRAGQDDQVRADQGSAPALTAKPDAGRPGR